MAMRANDSLVWAEVCIAEQLSFWFPVLMRITLSRYEWFYRAVVRKFYGYLKKCFPGFTHEDICDVMQEAFRDFWERSKKNALKPRVRLRKQLFRIARNRGYDLLRKPETRMALLCQPMPEDEEALKGLMFQALVGTETGSAYETVVQNQEADELHNGFRRFVNTCKFRQYEVGRVMADALPQALTDAHIADILTRAGSPTNAQQVKSAKTELRRKFDEFLKRKAKKDK